jgi:alcohol dehydrogenase (cytochrome c)
MLSSPITYELDGLQYMITSSGGVLFAWTLPESLAGSMTAAARSHQPR